MMNLRDGLLKKANESSNAKLPKVTKELESVIDLIIKTTTKDAEKGLYNSEICLTEDKFPEINYIYLDVLGFTNIENGLEKLKYVFIHLLDLSISIDVALDEYDEIVIYISWGYSIANDINNYLKIKDDNEMEGY